jgi:hypothetical protein
VILNIETSTSKYVSSSGINAYSFGLHIATATSKLRSVAETEPISAKF